MLASRWIAALALLGGLLATGLACGPDLQLEDESLFDPATGVSEGLSGFLFDPYSRGFGRAWGYGDHFREQNLQEWKEWLGTDSLATTQWDSVLYGATIPRLDSLVLHLQGKGKCPPAWKDFALLRTVPKERLLPALRYVVFAALVEPLSIRDHDEEWIRNRSLTQAPDTLHRDGLAAARKEKDPFLRQRWYFQLAKLCFYTGTEDGLGFLKEHEAALAAPSSSLHWRSRMYRAGLLRQVDTAAANLECARVAASYPLLAEMAANDFQVQEQKDMLRALAKAGSPKDKASIWFLAGLRTHDPAMIGEILALDSSSPYPRMLAVRHLSRNEFVKDTGLTGLRETSVRLAASRRTGSPAFWNLLAGHLSGLAGQEAKALSFLDSAAHLAGSDSILSLQVRTSRVLVRLRNARRSSPELEGFLMRELPPIDSARSARWPYFDQTLRTEMVRIWRASMPLSLTLGGLLPADRDSLQVLRGFRGTPGDAFTEFAKRRSPHSTLRILDELAAVHLYENRPALAVPLLEGGSAASFLGTDPFNAEITDDHDRDHQRFSQSNTTRLDYAREMARLETLADGKGPEAAKAALRLGIGLYNRTVFGNARILYAGTVLERSADARIVDLAPARRRFAQAARDLPSPEGRAWATWLLAKCERDARNDGSWPESTYALLRKKHSRTRFWSSALKECGWLSLWADQQESSRPD